MSDITINNEESQNKNQKTTPVTGSLFEPNNSDLFLPGGVFQIWLGIRDGNITFQDSLDFDLSEIDSVYDNNEGLAKTMRTY